MATLSTHVLDTTRGRPAEDLEVLLERLEQGAWARIGGGTTNDDGRIKDLLDAGMSFTVGDYRITFSTGPYHAAQGVQGFYPSVSIEFTVRDDAQHYHVPLLLNPFGYSTYRGS